MRHYIVAGNWKMHKNAKDTQVFLHELIESMPEAKQVEVVIAPPFTNLLLATQIVENTNIAVAAQNMHQADGGAYTGEISADMLKSVRSEERRVGKEGR